ncbi:ABC-type transport system, ATP-binding protein [Maize bushy stunt phytoplasma]|uniref:ABC-type transport system, ATP-binding protein n=1 Tax=Maize bushy stunt phytoplasma TaxID=202462 RepID=A0ABM6DM56_9MOLU|nr:ABC transporter ATP-binding protein [Maize bushy stunt phytoplasma]AOF54690.1 ABC-type transport system, ATP-binding protein [Maize bushy stunt phytoplasma]
MFNVNHLSKNYVTKRGNMTMALQDVSLKLPDKGMVFILGKSGSGKSTLLNVLTGIDVANGGVVEVCKVPITTSNQKYLDNYRNGMIGFIFQEFNLIEDMNVFENIVLALQLQNKKPDVALINDLMNQVGLDVSFLNRRVNELSGGQKQRVAIVRALVKNPKMVFADEPTGNLDSETGTQVFDLLQNLSKEKLVVIVSHDIESAYKYADRILECKDGKVVSDMTRKKDTTKKSKDKKQVFKEGQVLTAEMIANLTKNPALENFDKTDETKVLQQDTDFVSFPSCLPFSFVAKAALKSFKNKKFFLALAVLVTAIATFIFMFFAFTFLSYKWFGICDKIYQMYELFERYKGYEELYLFVGVVQIAFTTIQIISSPIFWVSILSVPGAMIMLYFSMSAKLQNKKMGILRALGSNGFNVGKIFLVEAFFFALFQMVLTFVLLLSILLWFKASILFSSFDMKPLPNFESQNDIMVFVNSLLNSKNKGILLWFTSPYLAFNPFVRVLLFNLLSFSYVFFMTLLFISFIIYKWSNKKPVDIINNK